MLLEKASVKHIYRYSHLVFLLPMSNRSKAILVFHACIFMITMNWLSSAWVFWWRTIEQISYVPWEILVPAAFTFAIWWVIYAGMLAFSIYQLRKSTFHDNTIQDIRPWVWWNFIANGLWLPAATLHWRSPLTIVLIIFMWISLGYINKYLQWYAHAKATRWYIVMPMSIYFGWITIATSLNIASVVNQYGFSDAITTVPRVLFWIGIAYVTSLVVFSRLRYVSYIAVTIWALIWVMAARQYDEPQVAWIALILIIAAITYIAVRGWQKKLILQ